MAQKFPTSLFLGLLIIVVIVAAYFVLMPRYNSFRNLENQLKKEEENLRNRQKSLTDLKELEENYSSAKLKVKDISNILPKEKQIPELLVQLEALAKENNLVLGSVSLASTAEGEEKAYKSLGISLELAGSYSNLKKYLDSVEKNMRIMDITSLNFSATPVVAEGPPDVFSYTVSMRTYYIE